ncbi:MAG: hypothetical protein IAF38_06325, partial [Bacteroidia bacterium]|nr:hypothetical protein [Bacteroidia bacterium]
MKIFSSKFQLFVLFMLTGSVCFSQKIKYTENYTDSLIQLKQYDAALETCNSMLKSDKKNAAFLRLRAFCYLKKEDTRNAISEYQKIISKSADCSDCMMNLSKAYLQLEKKDSATLWINKAIALNGTNGDYYITKASITLGSTKDSIENFSNLNKGIAFSPNAANYVLRARCYYGLGYLPLAKENVYAALKLNENNYDACFLNFLIQSAMAENTAAFRYADRCFKIEPANPKSIVLKAVLDASKGDTTGKIKTIDSVCAKNDKVAVLHLFRALFYRNARMIDAFCGCINYGFTKLKTNEDSLTYAIFGSEAGVVCDAKDLNFYTTRVSGMANDPAKIEEGIKILQQGQLVLPASCIIPFQISYFYTRQNKYDEAYREIQKSFG